MTLPSVGAGSQARLNIVAGLALFLFAVAGCGRRTNAKVSGGSPLDPSARSEPRPAAAPQGGPPSQAVAQSEIVQGLLEVPQLRAEMSKARGRPLFMHLWATWCAACLHELPLMERFARTARARGAIVLSVSLDSDWTGIARAPLVLRTRAPSLTTFVVRFEDTYQFTATFSPKWDGSIPALFAYDRGGALKASFIGSIEPSSLDAVLASLAAPSAATAATPPAAAPARSGASP
jgi:thiol-disulfide isomerase/thioredoxin